MTDLGSELQVPLNTDEVLIVKPVKNVIRIFNYSLAAETIHLNSPFRFELNWIWITQHPNSIQAILVQISRYIMIQLYQFTRCTRSENTSPCINLYHHYIRDPNAVLRFYLLSYHRLYCDNFHLMRISVSWWSTPGRHHCHKPLLIWWQHSCHCRRGDRYCP